MEMAVDLTGGLDVAREHMFTEPPTTPGMREGVNMWVWDDRGEIGFPRFAVEAVTPDWGTHQVAATLAFPDGRVLRHWVPEPAHPTTGPGGLPTIFGAGPLQFECIEPFRRHRASFKGWAVDTTFQALLKAEPDGPRVDLEYEIECEMAVPPWISGGTSKEAQQLLSGSVEGDYTGGDRFEQLFRAKGRVRLDGVERTFTGGGLRIRRQGVRKLEGFWGHVWQSALFPSGRGFGCCIYPPRADGKPTYNEGFIFTGDGALVAARVVEAPWLTRLQNRGEDVSLVLESKLGTIRIEGESALGAPISGFMIPFCQWIVRYRWDGEEAYGMMERSNLAERIHD
jgi:hypothetical protein